MQVEPIRMTNTGSYPPPPPHFHPPLPPFFFLPPNKTKLEFISDKRFKRFNKFAFQCKEEEEKLKAQQEELAKEPFLREIEEIKHNMALKNALKVSLGILCG